MPRYHPLALPTYIPRGPRNFTANSHSPAGFDLQAPARRWKAEMRVVQLAVLDHE
jgi:hypothetical protein